jgi:hypothetical protein
MKLKQLLSALLCVALLVCCAPLAFAAQDSATVMFWFANGDEIKTALELTVTDGTAESYGYTAATADHNGQAIETVSALDVVVAAHKEIYGDSFTAETANDYLSVSSGFMTKAFGIPTSNLGFTINDATPHDATYVEAYGGYTGYAIDTARVQDGDRVCLYTIQDSYWSDVLPLFDKSAVETAPNEAFTLSVSGYSVIYYGCSTQETIDQNTKALAGAAVECTQDFETFTAIGTLDENGKISVTLPDAGTYYLVVRGTFDDEDMGDLPLVANFCTVEVKEPETEEPEPEPDTFGAKYIPVFVRPVICFKNQAITLGIRVFFHDFNKKAPDMSKAFTFSISLKPLYALFK